MCWMQRLVSWKARTRGTVVEGGNLHHRWIPHPRLLSSLNQRAPISPLIVHLHLFPWLHISHLFHPSHTFCLYLPDLCSTISKTPFISIHLSLVRFFPAPSSLSAFYPLTPPSQSQPQGTMKGTNPKMSPIHANGDVLKTDILWKEQSGIFYSLYKYVDNCQPGG